MDKLDKENLFLDAEIPLINTRQERFNKVQFSAELVGTEYILTSEQGKLNITINDEVFLYVLVKFKFMPVWLAQQYYRDNVLDRIDIDTSKEKLKQFIDFGLMYQFPSVVANFLMPTNKLASLFNVKLGAFTNPPYNTLTHTISEEKVMLDCLSGKADYVPDTAIPYVSQFGLGEIGSVCIPEADYAIRNSYFNKHIKEFNDQEANLAKEMLEGKVITTPDFIESKLTIHKKVSQYEYDLKIPDLAVLVPRKIVDGVAMPQSVALEVELTNKGYDAYEKIVSLYWDNIKYGSVVYLTNDGHIKTNLLKAYKAIAQTGKDKTCDFYIHEFIIPYNERQVI